jgi:hypothetical protein
VRDRVGVVVDGARIDRSREPVVQEDVGGGDQEGKPVLVQRQHDDRDEEEEVGLDRSVPDVHERGRGGDHPDRDEHRGEPAVALDQQRGDAEREHDGDVPEAVEHPEALDQAEDRQPDRLGEQNPDERVMAAAPVRLGQGLSLRQDFPDSVDGAGVCGSDACGFHRLPFARGRFPPVGAHRHQRRAT